MIYDSMNDCYTNLNSNILDSIKDTDTDTLFRQLENIQEPTLVTGVGGSSVVATFMAKVLSEKNHIIATYVSPRDIKYMDLSGYKNIISVSYSGRNIGVDVSFDNDLHHYLFTGNKKEGIDCLLYKMNEEVSYVSISATMVPLSLLFLYYCNDIKLLKDIISSDIETDSRNKNYQVIYGYENRCAAVLLESSFNESGMASCILSDKYNYCHGRLNLSRTDNYDLIYFNSFKDIDEMMISQLPSHFNSMIIIDKKYDDPVINDYYCSYLSMILIIKIALNHHYDISDMKELEDNDLFYLFNKEM
ncbi:MAG: hypothetical protein Q4D13_01910 [Erysipelotrichaceae bacterium]|nr:hypothetical protein [Erysipelotrichaceae bacterium]